MRRTVLTITLVLLSVIGSSVLSPATHAQITTTPTLSVNQTTVIAGTGTTVAVTGVGFTPNYFAYVYYQRPDGSFNTFNIQTDANGAFSFALGFLAANGYGTEVVNAYDYATNRWANVLTIAVISGYVPYTGSLLLTAVPNPVFAGTSVLINGYTFRPNSFAYLVYQRPDGITSQELVPVGADGTFAKLLEVRSVDGCGTAVVTVFNGFRHAAFGQVSIAVIGC